MMNRSTKRDRRLESKKRKVEALLAVAKLNDQEKKRKLPWGPKRQKTTAREEGDEKKSKDVPNSDKPLLKGTDYASLKAELRERKRALKCLPKFDLKTVGHDAAVDVAENQRTPLFPSDLQGLLMYSMVGDRTPSYPFRWCKMEKWNRLAHVVCFVVDGLSCNDFITRREDLTKLEGIFPHKLEFLSPAAYGSCVARDLSILPLSNTQYKKLGRSKLKPSVDSSAVFPVRRSMFPFLVSNEQNHEEVTQLTDCLKLRLLLNARQMVEEGYPLPLPGPMAKEYEGFVLTSDSYSEASQNSPLFSVDCEMCMTVRRKMELTRICVVDVDLKVVYHTLVKPAHRIIDYVTRYSGITAEMLEGVTTTLSDVQKALRALLPDDAILVGQSLNSDLNAMQMMHPYVIDTSVIYNITGNRRRKSKLAMLAHVFLQESIQSQEKGEGHSPVEDAQAAMKLVKLKLEKGYEFGDVLLDGTTPRHEEDEKEPGASGDKEDNVHGTSMLDQLKKNGKDIAIFCQPQTAESYSADDFEGAKEFLEVKENAKEAVAAACARAHSVAGGLTICHVSVDVAGSRTLERKIKSVKKYTKRLWGSAPTQGMLVSAWSGDEENNMFVGITLKKDSVQ